MKHRLCGAILSVTLLISFLSASSVSAQSNHTLEWGVEVGDEITYVLQRKLLDEAIGSYLNEFMPFIDNNTFQVFKTIGVILLGQEQMKAFRSGNEHLGHSPGLFCSC